MIQTACIRIAGMICGGSLERVQLALDRLDGVLDAEVHLLPGLAWVRYDPAVLSVQALRAAIERVGFTVFAPFFDEE